MMMIDEELTPSGLTPKIDRLWAASAQKIDSIGKSCPPGSASPVFTVNGRYTARGWTEWTQGFQYGSALLQYDATGEQRFLDSGREQTVAVMASHVSHIGVHDHGFNNVSTYGNLWRLMGEGRLPADRAERDFYELALKLTGAVQAARWRTTADGTGYIYSFNGPQSLFVDTIRSCRALAVSHLLGHVLMGERDERISLLGRLIEHVRNTARWNIFYGEGRDSYDIPGRTAHESIFNVNDGSYRCPSTQQGYSPFSTWTRGLAWAMLGFPEQLEFIAVLSDEELAPYGGRAEIEATLLRAAIVTCDFYLSHSPTDGVPYWDTGAPGLVHLGDYRSRPADPENDHEPVDSSAAAIGAQGLLRLGHYLDRERTGRAGAEVLAGRADRGRHALRRAVPEHRRTASGTAAALDLPPAGGLGSCTGRATGAVRRVEHVGRLPCPRTGPLSTASGPGRAVLHVLRPDRRDRPMTGRPAALVTGGSRGIGRGIALALAGAGYDVVVNYAQHADAAAEVGSQVEALGGRAHLVRADVARAADRERLIGETVAAFGRLDLLVSNAGVAPAVRADLLDAGEESFDRLIDINLKGPYFLLQLGARTMISQLTAGILSAPKIVIISSISAYTASVNRGDYCVAKAGLAMTAQLYAARLAEHSINVYEIRPGIVETDMTGPVKDRYDELILDRGLTPIPRWGQPADVGKAVVAVATGLLPFSTGQVIDVDGGFHLRTL